MFAGSRWVNKFFVNGWLPEPPWWHGMAWGDVVPTWELLTLRSLMFCELSGGWNLWDVLSLWIEVPATLLVEDPWSYQAFSHDFCPSTGVDLSLSLKMNQYTLQGTNTYPPHVWHFEDDFLGFPRWDMWIPWRVLFLTSRAARGGGGSFKNRKRIGEIDCCEWGMSEQKHWPTD